MVAFDDFVARMIVSVRSLADEQANIELNIKADSPSQESFSHMLVDHTEIFQLVANSKLIVT